MEKKNYLFKFSVVTPVYNVEDYLEETIESVINQTIGFKDNIQMILVNDGSPDNSEEICLKYKEMYPDNIVYVKQENAGVSAARNHGVEYVQGKYVNFLDSDDKWELDAFEKVYEFFEKEGQEIDVVVGRMRFFEANNRYHVLDYKCDEGTRVIDIYEEYDCVHIHITSTFLREGLAKEMQFDTRLCYGEDGKYVTEAILKKQKYGVITEATHYYRKRAAGNSAIQTKNKSKKFYFDTPEYYYKDLLKISQEKFGEVISYVQFIIMYDLQWRLKEEIPQGVLTEEEVKNYKGIIQFLLQQIEDEIIIGMRNMFRELKLFALCFKYKRDIRCELESIDGGLYFHGTKLVSLKNKSFFQVKIIDVADGNLVLEGLSNIWFREEDYSVYIKVFNGENYPVTFEEIKRYPAENFLGVMYYKKKFRVEIPIPSNGMKLKVMLQYKEDDFARQKMQFGRLSSLDSEVEESYCIKENYILQVKDKVLHVIPYTPAKQKQLEEAYQKAIVLHQQEKENFCKEAEIDYKAQPIVKYRKAYWRKKKKLNKEIWLVSDRPDRADDNGEHFFRYMQTIEHPGIEVYYIIRKDCEDYKRMKKIGKVIPFGSDKHKLYFLLSSKIISSQNNDYTINAFGKDIQYVRDLYQFDNVFLQHGVIKDDLSEWLNKYNKNIQMFVTTGKAEYESILHGDYEYDESVVKLTGLPRYDRLKDESEKRGKERYIVFIPTWRKFLRGKDDPSTGEIFYNPLFKKSDFYHFYNSLINDERLIECMKKNGYKGKLCLHPMLAKQCGDFEGNDCIEVNGEYVDYQEEFIKGSLLITDYSSTFFDFAYLKKPIIYAQFDEEEFFSGEHMYTKGYFDYRTVGFGPVCTEYDSTVEEIINAIDRGCILEDEYLARIEGFYAYTDNNNCKRVYEEIRHLK